MDKPLRRPEEILACRTLARMLGPAPRTVWSVAPGDSVMAALQIMADRNIGFLVVLAYQSIDVVRAGLGQMTPGLQAPAAIFSASVLVSAVAMLAYTVVDVGFVVRALRQRGRSRSWR